MPFSKEDKALTTNLYQFNGHLSESIYISVPGGTTCQNIWFMVLAFSYYSVLWLSVLNHSYVLLRPTLRSYDFFWPAAHYGLMARGWLKMKDTKMLDAKVRGTNGL